MKECSLGSGFLNASDRFAERSAVEVDGKTWTYGHLKNKVLSVAATLQERGQVDEPPLTAVLAHRSVTAFSGILGALTRGHGYVPLHPDFPTHRTVTMLERSGCRSLIVGDESIAALEQVLRNIDRQMLILLPDTDNSVKLQASFPKHTFLDKRHLLESDRYKPVCPAATDTAYLLFTSGSTGMPKGVQISHQNISRFIEVVQERYSITEQDRFSQLFELVFDLSLFDMFVAWANGACVCCPSKGDAMLPAKFIKDSKISIWFSVPSLALAMKKMRMLRPDYYPDLRLSLFCGEALLEDVAATWADAAPNSIIENLYGPTEVTLACMLYRWQAGKSTVESDHGIVPIGEAFPGMTAIVTDEQFAEVAPGEDGELLMSGPQLAIGYWNDPEKTAAAFVVPAGKKERYYRTGDLVRRPGRGQPVQYLGRIDQQVKIRGNRVELGEIEAALRDMQNVDAAVALGWPITEAGVDGIVAFVQGRNLNIDALQSSVSARLPSYMAPKQIRVLDELPFNQNGKVDRKALLQILDNAN